MALVAVLHDQDLKHARQANKSRSGQQGQRGPPAPFDLPLPDRGPVNLRQCLFDTTGDPPDHESTNRQQRQQLNHRFYCDGDDHAVMAFVGVQITGAEQHREQRQPHRDPKRRLCRIDLAAAGRGLRLGAGKDRQGQGNRL